jgi:hypothetical protein
MLFTNKTSKYIILISALLFLFVVFVGVPHYISTGMMGSSMVSDCPFSAFASICSMNFEYHLSKWQQMTLFVPTVESIYLILISLTLLITYKSFSLLSRSEIFASRLSAVSQTSDYVPLPLQEIFSNGILNPKKYNQHS